MKNNFSNFIKIILIILGIVLLFGIVFYIITKNDTSNNHSNNSTIEPDKNIAVIEENLTTIFSYINNTKKSTNMACNTLGTDVGYDINSNDNFFDFYAPIIMDCLYEKNYPLVFYNNELNYKVINEEEWNTYKNYFINLSELTSIKDIYTVDILNTYNAEELEIIDYYIDNNYKILYPILNNTIKNNITYTIDRIFKKDDSYTAKITANINGKKYHGDLKINIVDKHCQYESLIFY